MMTQGWGENVCIEIYRQILHNISSSFSWMRPGRKDQLIITIALQAEPSEKDTCNEELFQERYNIWVLNLWPDFVFTPRFLIHIETSTWQWHLQNNSLKWGTIIKHGTCELILFLPQIPNTLWDLNLARTPGIRSAYIWLMLHSRKSSPDENCNLRNIG